MTTGSTEWLTLMNKDKIRKQTTNASLMFTLSLSTIRSRLASIKHYRVIFYAYLNLVLFFWSYMLSSLKASNSQCYLSFMVKRIIIAGTIISEDNLKIV